MMVHGCARRACLAVFAMAMAPQDPVEPPPGIEAPDAVAEGGHLVVQVNSGVKEIGLCVPGVGQWTVPVPKDGRVEWRLPPNVRGGHRIIVTDLDIPHPSSKTVDVVGSD
ncbi:MAG: hypothetical protein IPM29_01480 [Planctomycetes bacterium]|nr:hypothetical protein [Planctomycetota bacterium]